MSSPLSDDAAEAARAAPASRFGAPAYAAMVLAVALATALTAGIVGWRLGPPTGDLTRIGAYSEREFGWRGEAMAAAGADAKGLSLGALTSGADPGDILVFGDSFSAPSDAGWKWTEMLAARTGARVRVVRIFEFDGAMAWLRSEAARARPPRAVIFQSVERAAHFRAMKLFDPAAACAAPAPPAPVALPRRAAPPMRPFARRAIYRDFDELISRGILALGIWIKGPSQPVLRVTLGPDENGRQARFSSVVQNAALILGADVDNQTPRAYRDLPAAQAAQRVGCGLRRLIAAAQDAGIPALFVIAPDKRTAYAPWIKTPLAPPHVDLFAAAEAALGPAFMNLRPPLRAAIAEGVADVYWPNDTHWGAAGARIAAEAVLDRLTRPGDG